jgi:tetratricopeptide (TPR) repeat protein
LSRYEESIVYLQQAIANKPNYAEAYNNLGVALYKSERYEEALENYNSALKVRAEFAEAYFNIGILLSETRQNEEAISSYEQAISINPRYLDALYNLASLYEKLNQIENSNIWSQKIFQFQAEEPKANRLAAVLLRRDKKYQEALNVLKNISLDKLDIETTIAIHFEMGKVYDLIEESESAITHFEKANQAQ